MLIPKTKKLYKGGQISAREYNRRGETLKSVSRSLSRNSVSDATGVHGRAILANTEFQTGITIFSVVDANATGYGVYNCYKMSLDSTEWTDTAGDNKFDRVDANWSAVVNYNVGDFSIRWSGVLSYRYICVIPNINQEPPNANWAVASDIEVLNLYENNPVSSYEPALGRYDKIKAWPMIDDEGNTRWVGIPLTPQIREVQTHEAAPNTAIATNSITCHLRLSNGLFASSGEEGHNIEIYGLCVGGTADWDEVVPRIALYDEMTAQNIQGKWFFTTNFAPSENCDCYQE